MVIFSPVRTIITDEITTNSTNSFILFYHDCVYKLQNITFCQVLVQKLPDVKIKYTMIM